MTCCQTQAHDMRPVASPDGIAQKIEEERIRAASRQLEQALCQTEFIVPDMHCGGCISTIERGLSKLSQVATARANLSTRTVVVVWDTTLGNGTELVGALKKLGFDGDLHLPGNIDTQAKDDKGRRLLNSLAVAGFAAANIMLLSISVWSGADVETTRLFHLLSALIAVPAVAYAGQPFFASARKALAAQRLNMDVPISLAVVMALAMSLYESLSGGEEAYFDAAVTLLFFLLIGRYLDHLMRQKARGAVDRLARLASKGGVLIDEVGGPTYVDLKDIRLGMRLRINPGERLPVDGQVLIGSSDVDRALVTGEGDSVACHPGDKLEAGVLNLTGSIDIIATSDATTSFLAEISAMMNAAEKGRGQYVGLADRLARIYAPAVHLLALATFVGWMIHTAGDWHASLYTAIAVLIITCPCALGLAVPVVHVIGAHQLMRRGIMMRDGTAFERLVEADTVAFDKTGTLTMGEPMVVATSGVRADQRQLLAAVAALSSHPAARAVFDHVNDATSVPLTLDDVREIPGFGVEARYGLDTMRFGRSTWVAELSADNSADSDQSGVGFALKGGTLGIIQLEDKLRPQAVQTVQALQSVGLAVEIISGDHANAVSGVARQLGVTTFFSRMTPTEKIQHIRALQENGRRVLMVGDGLNDAPALAAAHVSMAPASASDVGRLASDLVFTQPELSAVVQARQIALKTGQLVRQNFTLALLYNCFAVPLAIAGQVTPLIAAIAMSSSSIVVIANSMRLNLFKDGLEATRNAPAKDSAVETSHAATAQTPNEVPT
jgi:Cu2+-exporting ATPase